MTKENGEFTHRDSVDMKDYVDTRFAALEAAMDLSRLALNDRLGQMNEIREAMRDRDAQMTTKAEHEAICRDVRALQEEAATLRGKASQASVVWAMVIGGVGITTGIIGSIVSLVALFGR